MTPECSGKIAGKDTGQSKIQIWFWIQVSRKLEGLHPLQLCQFAPKSKWHKHHNLYHVFEKFALYFPGFMESIWDIESAETLIFN